MANSHLRKCLALVFCACVMTACSHKNVVVLVPDPDGRVGSITVANAAGSVEIDTANESTTISDAETAPGAPAEMKQKDIDNIFGQALAIQPQPPERFILYFERNSTRLRPSSLAMLPDIIAAIQMHRSEHISVVGHSDTLGDKSYNLALSKRRAVAVKKLLVKNGVDKAFIETTSHGEDNPLVKTADNVGNPKIDALKWSFADANGGASGQQRFCATCVRSPYGSGRSVNGSVEPIWIHHLSV